MQHVEAQRRAVAGLPLHRAGETEAVLFMLEVHVARKAREHGIVEADVRPIAPSLEDVFVALTARAAELNKGTEVARV